MTGPVPKPGTHPALPAALVAAGMVVSRLSGYARQALFSNVFGLKSDALDAFNAALRIPNFLQNLLGEGVLSASLIPVYSGLLQGARQKEADRVARSVLGLLVLATSAAVLIGMIWTPQLVLLTGVAYKGEKFDLVVRLARILFPGVGLLVFSAWCLAILNSHHKFFLAYVAPVLWNASMIVVLVAYRGGDPTDIAIRLAWAAVIGSGLQLGIQVPTVWRIMAPRWSRVRHELDAHVRRVITTSVPVFFSRGAVQVSSLIDGAIATHLPTGALTAFSNATALYQLPVALFGMGVSAAALPSMSAAVAGNVTEVLRERLLGGQRAIAVLVIPSMVAFLAFGDVMIALLLQHGRFTADDTSYVWGALAGSSIGLLATTVGRLYSAAFFALGDTKTPMRFALVRVALVGVLGYLLAIVAPRLAGVPLLWGTAGLTASAGLAGWVEFSLLRVSLERRIGGVAVQFGFLARTWLIAVITAIPATALRWVLAPEHTIIRGLVILTTYGLMYLAAGLQFGLLTMDDVRGILRGRTRGGRPTAGNA
jgi:putative peptidoglycan lipid II flippase